MASEEHKAYANIIKNVHSSLRKLAKEIGHMEAWTKHCKDSETLQLYAKNMKLLAIHSWEENALNPETKVVSRIKWISEYCLEYFFGKIEKYRLREKDIANKINILIRTKMLKLEDNVIEVLDVGSCYNPFRDYDFMHVLPIDLCPAEESVVKCDFLNVALGKLLVIQEDSVSQLSENSYDAVIFSLFLEYLPSSSQRKKCCEKAYRLLKTEGVLIIVTPDSKHVGANAKLIKNWGYTLSLMGFSRIHYEKLQFLHCLVFRKSIEPRVAQRWAELYKEAYMTDEIYIPQDFQNPEIKYDEDSMQYVKEEIDVVETFQQLPYAEL